MVLQASGAISFADLRDEFGDDSGSVQLARYYRGTDGEVPPPYSTFNPNIPTSGSSSSISMNDFYSAQNIWAVTIVSTGEIIDKFGQAYGYEDGVLGYGQLGTNGNQLYNLDGQLTIARGTNNTGFGGGTSTLTVRVSGGTSITRAAFTRLRFIGPRNFTVNRNDFTINAGATATVYSLNTGITASDFEPEGSQVTMIFDTQ